MEVVALASLTRLSRLRLDVLHDQERRAERSCWPWALRRCAGCWKLCYLLLELRHSVLSRPQAVALLCSLAAVPELVVVACRTQQAAIQEAQAEPGGAWASLPAHISYQELGELGILQSWAGTCVGRTSGVVLSCWQQCAALTLISLLRWPSSVLVTSGRRHPAVVLPLWRATCGLAFAKLG